MDPVQKVLIRVFTICLQSVIFNLKGKMKTTTQQPKIGNGLILLIRVDEVRKGGKDQESKQSSTTSDPK